MMLAIAFITGVSGCVKETIYGRPTADGFITTDADVPFVVNGVNSIYQEYALYKSSAHAMIQYSSDDFSATGVSSGFSIGLFLTHGESSTDSYIGNSWRSFFRVINNANSAMDAINNAPGLSAAVRKRAIGELLFLRGFTYFNLVRLFGGVPIRTQQTLPSSNFYERRSTVDSVYRQIFADLTQANENCIAYREQISKYPAEFGLPTKGAAQATLALAYLTYGNYLDFQGKSNDAQANYTLANNYSDSVILSNQYTLIPNFNDLFDVTKEKQAYDEVILGIQQTRDATTAGAGSKGSEMAFYTQSRYLPGVCGNAPTGVGIGQLYIQPWFFDLYNTGNYNVNNVRDYRADFSFNTDFEGITTAGAPARYVSYPVITANATGLSRQASPFFNKYKDPNGLQNRNNENDEFMIRLAEVYLIKAEALNELGRTAEAYAPFNMLRARARNANGTARTVPLNLTTGLSKENFRMAVFNERGLELIGEFHRWFDAVRTRYMNTNVSMLQWRFETFYPSMPASNLTLPVWDATSKTWKGGRVQPVTVKPWNVRFLSFPIPATEIASNPQFGDQNEGW